MSYLRIFISATTKEFGSYRVALRDGLKRHNFAIDIQETFEPSGLDTLEKLHPFLKDSDVVVHLIGERTGGLISSPSLAWIQRQYPDLPDRFPALREVWEGNKPSSYTQWEAYLARYHGRMLLLAVPTSGALPDSTPFSPTESPPEVQHQQQQAHLARLAALHCHPEIKFEDVRHLTSEVLRSRLYDMLVQAGVAENQSVAARPSNLPYLSLGPLFMGRDPFMQMLREKFAVTPKANKAIYGLGGIGKTRLAVEYAWQYQREYSALLFVGANTPADLEANLAGLAKVLLSNQPDLDTLEQQERLQVTLTWLAQHSGWLIILDNVDTVEAVTAAKEWLLRFGKGHVLMTTRVSEWGKHIECLEVGLLQPVEAQAFLLERTPHRRTSTTDEADSLALVHDLGQLSLALETAGAYIDANHITLLEYRTRWATNAEAMRSWFDEHLIEDYSRSVAITWQTSFSQLTSAAQTLLNRLAWLAAEPIPISLMEVRAPGAKWLNALEACRDLARYSLLAYTANYTAFSVHRLVLDVTRASQQGSKRRNTFKKALQWIDLAFTGDPLDVRNWPTLEALRPHALEVSVTHAPKFGNPAPNELLLRRLGQLLLAKAEFKAAEPLLRRALAIAEARFGPDLPYVTLYLNGLAELLRDTNRLAEAEPLFRRALALTEARYGPDHPDIALCINNLAVLLCDTNRLAEAELLFRRALAIDEASHGPDHPTVATRLNNLASLLRDTNRLAEAEPLYRRAIALTESRYGPDHPKVATYLNNLGQVLRYTNRLAEAEPLLRSALAIGEASLGPNHPNVAIRLNNLAELLRNTNRLAEAEPLHRRALAIDEASYGPDHPDVAVRLNNLALLLSATHRLSEAEILYRKAISILVSSKAKTGHYPKNFQTIVNNYTTLLHDSGKSVDEVIGTLASLSIRNSKV